MPVDTGPLRRLARPDEPSTALRTAGRATPDKYHYGAPPPRTDTEARDLILLLGYPLPDVRDVSANEIETDYYYFIRRLAAGKAATNLRDSRAATDKPAVVATARARFLARVAASRSPTTISVVRPHAKGDSVAAVRRSKPS
jgi:hypothetical protein